MRCFAFVAFSLLATVAVAQSCVTTTPQPGVGLGRISNGQPQVPFISFIWDQDGDGPAPEKLVTERRRFLLGPGFATREYVAFDGQSQQIIPLAPSMAQAYSVAPTSGRFFVLGQLFDPTRLGLLSWDGTQWRQHAIPPLELVGVNGTTSIPQMIEVDERLLIVNMQLGDAQTIFIEPDGNAIATSSKLVGNVSSLINTGGQIYAVGGFTLDGVPRAIARLDQGDWVPVAGDSALQPSFATGIATYDNRLFAFLGVPSPSPNGVYELTAGGWQLVVPSQIFWTGLNLVSTSQGLAIVTRDSIKTIRDGQFVASTRPFRSYSGGFNPSAADTRFIGTWQGQAIFRTAATAQLIRERLDISLPGYLDLFAANISGIAATDGTNIINITGGFDNIVNQFITYNGHRYAVGHFRSAGGRAAYYIARQENGLWAPLNAENGPQGGIAAAAIWNNKLAVLWHEYPIAGGVFARVSIWDGQTWQDFGAPPFAGFVTSLANFENQLYITSENTIANVFVRSIHRSTGGDWESVPVPAFIPELLSSNAQTRIFVEGGQLQLQWFRGYATWNGSQWQYERSGDLDRGLLYIGEYNQTPIAVNSDGTYAKRNGQWHRVAPGTTPPSNEITIQLRDELIVVSNPAFDGGALGGFTTRDRLTINSWNGATWSARTFLTSGIERTPNVTFPSIREPSSAALDIDSATGKLLVGGAFLADRTGADFFTVLDLKPRIAFTQVPLDTRIQPGSTATLAVNVSSEGQFTYQWSRDNTPLTNTTLPTGEVITGATSPTLTITSATAAINGSYICTVTPVDATQFCSPESTAPIQLTAERFCDDIDFNNNTVFPEDQDVIDYLTVLAGGPCSTNNCNDLDFNNNTITPEDQDTIDFFTTLAGGACP